MISESLLFVLFFFEQKPRNSSNEDRFVVYLESRNSMQESDSFASLVGATLTISLIAVHHLFVRSFVKLEQ